MIMCLVGTVFHYHYKHNSECGESLIFTVTMFKNVARVFQCHYGHVSEWDSVSLSLWPCFRVGQCFSVIMATFRVRQCFNVTMVMFQSGTVFQCHYGHVSELGDMLARARSRKAISRWTTTTVNFTSSASIKTESQPIGFLLHIDCGTADFHSRCRFAAYVNATIHLGPVCSFMNRELYRIKLMGFSEHVFKKNENGLKTNDAFQLILCVSPIK